MGVVATTIGTVAGLYIYNSARGFFVCVNYAVWLQKAIDAPQFKSKFYL